MKNNRKLYKIEHGKKLFGVCGGVAEYFGLDATLVRIAWALLVCFAGTGVLFYILCAFIMPDKSDVYPDIM